MQYLSIDQIVDEIKEFLDFVNNPTDNIHSNEIQLLLWIDSMVFAYHSIVYQFDNKLLVFDNSSFPDIEGLAYESIRKQIGKRFPSLGYYHDVDTRMNESGIPEFSVGDCIDDITDIYIELFESVQRIQNNSISDGLWNFQYSYKIHWGFHARGLQRHLHEVCF